MSSIHPPQQAAWRPVLRAGIFLTTLLLWTAFATTTALADVGADVGAEDGHPELVQPKVSVDSHEDTSSIPFYAPPSMPPLPFRQPQIGPDIKRAYADDVNRRTTAFVPQPGVFVPDFDLPDEAKWIWVDLSDQRLVAYENGHQVRAFTISSGLPRTPTVTGEFRIRVKVRSQTMSGGDPELGNDYNLPNVEWVQYFYEDYGFHGTYWHNNFGNPMSHGCVNMTNADAKWLFDWAGPTWEGDLKWQKSTEENAGTLVIVRH